MQRGYRKLSSTENGEALKKLGLRAAMPKDFIPVFEKENFIWFRREMPKGTQGFLVYTFPFKADYQMSAEYLLNIRDSLCKVHVKGEIEDSYMSTEYRYIPDVRNFELNDMYTVHLKGLWRMEGDFMGGPFISQAMLDEQSERIIFIDGFVFAPEDRKRNLTMQLEAISRSFKTLPSSQQ